MQHLITAGRLGVVAVAVAAPLALGACADDPDSGMETAPAPTATVEKSPEINDITSAYFADPSYVGRTVTVKGTVSKVIGPTSFVLEGKVYGDDTLLVVSAPGKEVKVGQETEVTGTVRKFGYGDYADGYDLAEPGVYEDFGAEEILVVGGPSGAPGSSSPSAGG